MGITIIIIAIQRITTTITGNKTIDDTRDRIVPNLIKTVVAIVAS